jgi:hypothetical protein
MFHSLFFFFVIVGLDTTIQKVCDKLVIVVQIREFLIFSLQSELKLLLS